MNLVSEALKSLEEKSWFCAEGVIPSLVCDKLIEYQDEKFFKKAAIGQTHLKSLEPTIRKSQISWIENWDEIPELLHINEILSLLMKGINEHFFLSLKRLESQFALYESGGFYKKHIDQHQKTKNRLVTCIFYLNDCPDSGELVLYNKDNKKLVDDIIFPQKGKMVIFFSGHIFHEVKKVDRERLGITTWMRNDQIIPFL